MITPQLAPHELHLPNYYSQLDYLKTSAPKHSASPATFIIDYGSFTTKAGCLESDADPSLVCLSEIFRTKRANTSTLYGGDSGWSKNWKRAGAIACVITSNVFPDISSSVLLRVELPERLEEWVENKGRSQQR